MFDNIVAQTMKHNASDYKVYSNLTLKQNCEGEYICSCHWQYVSINVELSEVLQAKDSINRILSNSVNKLEVQAKAIGLQVQVYQYFLCKFLW